MSSHRFISASSDDRCRNAGCHAQQYRPSEQHQCPVPGADANAANRNVFLPEADRTVPVNKPLYWSTDLTTVKSDWQAKRADGLTLRVALGDDTAVPFWQLCSPSRKIRSYHALPLAEIIAAVDADYPPPSWVTA